VTAATALAVVNMDSEEIIAIFVFGVLASAVIFGVAAFVL
jgi:hypothetical protein